MSRIGKLPVQIPDNIAVTVDTDKLIVKGPKGEITVPLQQGIEVAVEEKQVIITRKNEIKAIKALHGATRNLINNAIIGVRDGYQKTLELVGTGYRVRLDGKDLNLSLGFSHPVIVKAVSGITFAVDGQNKIIVSGYDKHLVGQLAADIRAIRPPEPYKGKGVKYENEIILKKAGKTSKGE